MKNELIEEASTHYAHNYFEMHETNNYKALKQGFEAGVKWCQEQGQTKSILKDYDKTQVQPYFQLRGDATNKIY